MKKTTNYIFAVLARKEMLYVALFLSIITYSFWMYFPKGFFYKGNASFLFIFVSYLYANERSSFIKHLIFHLSLNYLFKEFFLDPSKLYDYEAVAVILIPLTWFIKYGKFT